MEKKAIHIFGMCKHVPVTHRKMFLENRILTVVSNYRIWFYVYKNIKRIPKARQYTTRNPIKSNYLFLSRPQFSHFNNNAIKVYNHLNNNIKDCNDIKIFDRKLKQFFINRPLYSIKEYFTNALD
jgi:hypothetical protein